MYSVARKWVSSYFAPVPRSEAQSYTTTYDYSGLPPSTRSFRVFRLFPQRVGDQTQRDRLSGVLRGRIELVDLDNPKGYCYDALSYCWEGSIEPSPYLRQGRDRVIIEASDGSTSQVAISPALATALRFLRARGQSLPLFVDQICINQVDNAEKSQQINFMGDIYRNCECVLAWLDVATKYTDALFDFLPRISNNEFLLQLVRNPQRSSPILKAAMEKRTDFSEEATLRQDVDDMIKLTRDHWGRFPHRGYLDVCLRRWFRRIWIVQEACLGPKMVFVCGSRSCSVEALEAAHEFKMLASSVENLEGARNPLERRQAKWDWEAMHNALMSSVIMFRIFRERAAVLGQPGDARGRNMRQGLDYLVNRFNVDVMAHGPWIRLGSSNPRDYIYALKGLVSAGDPVSGQLVTNYALSAATIFTEFTRICLDPSNGTPPIDTLLLSQMETKKVEKLPTWVPDWSADLVIPCGYRAGCFPIFNAGGGLHEPYTFAEVDVSKPGILRVKAVLLCEADRVGKHFMKHSSRRLAHPIESPVIMARSIFNFFREVREMCTWASGQPNSASIPSTANLDEAVWLTTTGGHGLTQTTERTPMGRQTGNGQPLLGYLWDFQLRMDVLPTIMKRRGDSLSSIGDTWTTNTRRSTGSRLPFLSKLRASFFYWGNRLIVESFHVFWLWRYLCVLPYVLVRRESEDMIYHGVFGAQKTEIGILKSVLARHVRRKCFASGAGHVGLGPVGMLQGDVVVVPLGASVPVILRPGPTVTEPWTYVGEAYCHGFMDREALMAGTGLGTRWFEIK